MISGIGVIESGINGSRPNLPTYLYGGTTNAYQLAYITNANLADLNFKVSATDRLRNVNIVENQLVGINRTHWNLHSWVLKDGIIEDKSSPSSKILSISGLEAFIGNVYVGNESLEKSWSGLSTGLNYLWINSIEDKYNDYSYNLTSRQYRDFECRSTNTLSEPVEGKSLLLGTYVSGVFTATRDLFTSAKEHQDDNTNPHLHLTLNQNYIVCSGVNVLNTDRWNYDAASGNPIFTGFSGHLNYLTDVVQYGTLITSGILGNVLSGSLTGTLLNNIINFEADPANIGYQVVTSGMSISGSHFRQPIYLGSGINFGGADVSQILPSVSNICLSGNNISHYHSLSTISGVNTVVVSPQYFNCVFQPKSFGNGSNYNFEYNSDLGFMKPTLRYKSLSDAGLYIRQIVPTNYKRLDSISLEYKVDNGHSYGLITRIIDSSGVTITPTIGNTLSSKVLTNGLIAGISSNNFGQHNYYDLYLSFRTTSGKSIYLGDIKFNYVSF